MLTAGFDPLVDEGKAYAERLAKEGVQTEYRNYPDMVHGFITMGRVLDTANAALADCALRAEEGLGRLKADLKTRHGGRILADALAGHGVRTAFGVPGESFLPVLDGLHDLRDKLKFVICRQEGGASYMAEAWAKLTGEPGVLFVTRGPGATNGSVGVHTAFQDSTPMVVFVGQVGNDFVEREAFQEVDYRRMYGPLTKWVAQIDRAERIPEYVSHAFHTATAGRPGPGAARAAGGHAVFRGGGRRRAAFPHAARGARRPRTCRSSSACSTARKARS